ncbi:hypothetical protein BT69DRAFT_1319610 [Atractiella rhizophila]|nr:hypothetical protein BT69DRAFT_1319610 [Atractiella rhizophila]
MMSSSHLPPITPGVTSTSTSTSTSKSRPPSLLIPTHQKRHPHSKRQSLTSLPLSPSLSSPLSALSSPLASSTPSLPLPASPSTYYSPSQYYSHHEDEKDAGKVYGTTMDGGTVRTRLRKISLPPSSLIQVEEERRRKRESMPSLPSASFSSSSPSASSSNIASVTALMAGHTAIGIGGGGGLIGSALGGFGSGMKGLASNIAQIGNIGGIGGMGGENEGEKERRRTRLNITISSPTPPPSAAQLHPAPLSEKITLNMATSEKVTATGDDVDVRSGGMSASDSNRTVRATAPGQVAGGVRGEEERRKRRRKRRQVARELLQTERTYLAVLERIDRDYFSPLLSALPSHTPNPSSTAPNAVATRQHQPRRSGSNVNQSAFGTGPGGRRTSVYTPRASFDLAGFSSGAGDLPPSPISPSASSFAGFGGGPGEEGGEILSRKTVNSLFPGFADILVLSREMEHRLSKAVPQPDLTSSVPSSASTSESEATEEGNEEWLVGTAIAPIMPFLRSYSLFIRSFDSILLLLSALDFPHSASSSSIITNPKTGKRFVSLEEGERWRRFVSRIKERERESGTKDGSGGMGLGGMLLNVVQRLPRYQLLLGELKRYTEEGSEDLVAVEKSLKVVEEAAQFVDEQIKQHDLHLKTLSLQSSLSIPLLIPGRKLICDGAVRRQSHKGGEEDIVLYLFSDILLVHNVKEEKKTEVLELEFVNVVLSFGKGREGGAFEIRSNTKSFVVFPPTVEKREFWIEKIRSTKEDLLVSRSSIAPRATLKFRRRSEGEKQPFFPHFPVPEEEGEGEDEVEVIQTSLGRKRKEIGMGTGERHSAPTTGPGEEAVKPDVVKRWSDVFNPSPFPLPSSSPSPSSTSSGSAKEAKIAEDYSAPIWVPDDKANACMVCGSQFGIFRRKHHCRLCGRVVCYNCSKKTFIIPHKKEKETARSCDACFKDVFEKDPGDVRPGETPTLKGGQWFDLLSPACSPAFGEDGF